MKILHSIILLLILMTLNCSSGQVIVSQELKNPTIVNPQVTGEACGFIGLLATAYYFVPIEFNSRVERAYSDALGKAPGATGLRNVTITETWSWIVVGTMKCYEVSGEAIR